MRKLAFSLIILAALCFVCSNIYAGETWDKIKNKTQNTKQKTKLKMKVSDYQEKIAKTYTQLGERIYKKSELKGKVSSDPRSSKYIQRLDIYNQKIAQFEEKIKELETGEDVTDEDIEDIEMGLGVSSDTNSAGETEEKSVSEEESEKPEQMEGEPEFVFEDDE